MLYPLKNSRNIMELWTAYCKAISPKFCIFQHKSSVRYCIMCSIFNFFFPNMLFLSFKDAIFIWCIDSLEIYSESVTGIKNSTRLFLLNFLQTFFNADKVNYFEINLVKVISKFTAPALTPLGPFIILDRINNSSVKRKWLQLFSYFWNVRWGCEYALGSQYARVLNMSQVLNMPGF